MQRRIEGFGMDTITLASPLEAKHGHHARSGLLAGNADGARPAGPPRRRAGLRPTGFQVLRDFEGLSGHLHGYKVDIAKDMLEMCAATGSRVLLACSSTLRHASQDLDDIARDLRKLATLAAPLDIRVAYEGRPSGRTLYEFTTAWEWCGGPTVPTWGWASTPSTSSRPRHPWPRSTTSTPSGSSWCNGRTSCETKRRPSRTA